jgi:hypothetical protein
MRRIDIAYIKEVFANEGCTILSDAYTNGNTRIYYICNEGHYVNTTWRYWKNGQRCKICGVSKGAETNSADIAVIRAEFERIGYTLVSDRYVCGEKLEYVCSKGHTGYVDYYIFKWREQRCKQCNLDTKLSARFEYVKEALSKEHYTLLSTEYKSAHDFIECTCPNGHKYKTRWYNWKTGHRCNKCARIRYSVIYSGDRSPSWRGGLSLNNYCSAWQDNEYRQYIKDRDKNTCQNPYCFKMSNKLSIHHIDYNKSNCHPNNLITLCVSCNSMANRSRKWHSLWYQTIMNKKFKYMY